MLNIIVKQMLVHQAHAIASCMLCILAYILSACSSVVPSATIALREAGANATSSAEVRPTLSSMPTALRNTCSATQPPVQAFTPPTPYSSQAPSGFWYGMPALWIDMPSNGVWSGLPHNSEGYTQKIFWWHEGYSPTKEPLPDLIVSGQRLDASAPPLNVSQATNASGGDIYSAMLVVVDFPILGCWQITGHYAGAELSFVVQVTL